MPVIVKKLHLFLAVAALLCVDLTHAATDHAATEQVQIRLIPEQLQVRPGQDLTVGVEQKIAPHWHTYWMNPGDSGLATSITWDLPPGVSADPIQWPVPSRYTVGSITNYGYADQVVLLSRIHVPASLKPGSALPLRAQIKWLVCQDVCIPQQAELETTLTIAAPSQTPAKPNPLIQSSRARLPLDAPWISRATYTQDKIELRIAAAELKQQSLQQVQFYPAAWGKIDHSAPQAITWDGDQLVITMHPGETPKPEEALDGVLAFAENTAGGAVIRGFSLHAQATPATASTTSETALLPAILLALAGGIILNLMPCVFPVLSIKALSLVRHGTHAETSVRLQGVAYTVGVVLSFLLLAGVLLALRAGGAQVGWGFQFQSPGFVLATAWLLFAMGLSLSGVFTLGNSISGLGEDLTEKPGYAGSFFTGALATLVATPCTAPFMGVAIAYALGQGPLKLIAVFTALGIGLALPYLLLTHWPALQRRLPKPGPWMERLKQILAFPMYGTALWLSWVLVQQAGPDSMLFALSGMLIIAFAAWLFNSTRPLSDTGRLIGSCAAIALVFTAILFAWQYLTATTPVQPKLAADTAQNYSEERLQTLRAEGKPVFLDFTAAWCITCLVNERVALNQEKVRAAFTAEGIQYLKGDWTNQDASITKKLAEFGRNGVPLYVFYPAGKGSKPLVLPQILTPELVLEQIHSRH